MLLYFPHSVRLFPVFHKVDITHLVYDDLDQTNQTFSESLSLWQCVAKMWSSYSDAHVTIIIWRSPYHDMFSFLTYLRNLVSPRHLPCHPLCRPRHPRQRRHIHRPTFIFKNCIVYSLVVQNFPFGQMFCNYIIKHKCFFFILNHPPFCFGGNRCVRGAGGLSILPEIYHNLLNTNIQRNKH